MLLETNAKPKNAKASRSSDTKNEQGFSGYLDQSSEKSSVKSEAKSSVKDDTRETDNKRSEAKVEKDESKSTVEKNTSEMEDANTKVSASSTDNDSIEDAEKQGVESDKVLLEVKDSEPSTAALVNLMLQRAIKSNVGESSDKSKSLDNAILATQQHTSALDALIQKNTATKDKLTTDVLVNQDLKQSIEKLSPELAKLLLADAKNESNGNKLQNLNGKQELLTQMQLKPVDEVMEIKQETDDLIAKFLEKLDLNKNKGEVLFQNRMTGDKAAVSADVTEPSLMRMGSENGDKNILLNSMTNSERLNSSAAVQQSKMNVPMTNPDWGVEFGKRIKMLMNNNIQHAEIRMDPPGLGSIQVRINMNQDQANISFTALHANVREAIETNMNRLREMLGESGLQLGEADVNSQFQQQTNQRSEEQGQFAMQKQTTNSVDENELTDMPATMVQHSIDGVIDYFA